MSGSTLAEDPQGEGAFGALALFSMLSLDGSSPTLVEEPDSELEPNPFELMASDMLAIISDLRNSLHSIESKESADKGVEKGNSYDPDSESLQNLASTPASRVKRFWPFKGSLPLVKSTATLPSSDPASEQLTEAWRWLLDACLDTVNRAIAAQVILETAADVKNHKPPLFWLLYAGHRALQTLQEFVRSDGSSTPSLDKWNPHPLLRWCSEAKARSFSMIQSNIILNFHIEVV
ncbi:hypothetical protein DL93DRAFT_412712 [Clavulina sp. PMI_390]|nr:hypothetical protein DL93DRAFT_412712 [Clavulina sp. PMI_390]